MSHDPLIEKIFLNLPWSFIGPVVGFGIPTAVMTTLALRRNVAVRELARHNERERIARDMHDVLGHTRLAAPAPPGSRYEGPRLPILDAIQAFLAPQTAMVRQTGA